MTKPPRVLELCKDCLSGTLFFPLTTVMANFRYVSHSATKPGEVIRTGNTDVVKVHCKVNAKASVCPLIKM